MNLTGYDGQSYAKGDRVELHPSSAGRLRLPTPCYGRVRGVSFTWRDNVRVELDERPGLTFGGPQDYFRKA